MGRKIVKTWNCQGRGNMTKINSMKKERQKRFFAICSSNLTWVLVLAEISVKYSVKEIMKASHSLSHFSRMHILCPL